MFSDAYKLASKYTFPVLISSKLMDGTLESGVGAFVIINEEGWFMTAAHVLSGMLAHQQHVVQYQEFIKQKTNTSVGQIQNGFSNIRFGLEPTTTKSIVFIFYKIMIWP